MLTEANALLMLALVLVAGVASGHVAKRLHLPSVTGQILVGILIGPAVPAMPHGVLEGGSKIVGAMGLSDEGLDLETPDGMPVHCMVLLATPPSERDRHLEVLAALARVIGSDPNVRRELFGSRTAAHAFEVLHAEASEEFNPFLPEGPFLPEV